MQQYTEAQIDVYDYLYDMICNTDDPNGNANKFYEEYEKNPDDVIYQIKIKLHLWCHPNDIKEVIEDFEQEFIEE